MGTTPKVEVLAVIDASSGGVNVEVWADGVKLDDAHVAYVDTGAGGTVSGWNVGTEERAADATTSEQFRAAVVAARNDALENHRGNLLDDRPECMRCFERFVGDPADDLCGPCDEATCKRCGDDALHKSSDGLCDGCVEDEDDARARELVTGEVR